MSLDYGWAEASERDHAALVACDDAWDAHLEDAAEARAAARWERRLANLRPLFRRGAWRARTTTYTTAAEAATP